VHLRPGAASILIPEKFSWGAAIFGPIWLLAHRAWIAAAISLLVIVAIGALSRGTVTAVLWLAYAWLLGLFAHDLWRWALEARGYALVHVVAARDAESAHARLFAARPDLVATSLA
jgi:hypothetical protein